MSRHRNRWAAGAAVALSVLLAGCAGTTTRTDIFTRDLRSHVSYAAATPPTGAIILNSPVDPAAVVAAMRGRNPGPPIAFVLGPSPTSLYRVVVSFGAPPLGSRNWCQATNLAVAPAPAGRTEVSAEFCVGAILLSEASASSRRIESAQDPRLQHLMSDLLEALMPYNNSLYNDVNGPM